MKPVLEKLLDFIDDLEKELYRRELLHAYHEKTHKDFTAKILEIRNMIDELDG